MNSAFFNIKEWIIKHDDSIVFTIFYIGLSVALSMLISLFWLLAIVSIHYIFEIVKIHRNNSFFKSLLLALWEVKLDIVLVLFAIWLAVYLDYIFGIVGMGVGSRAIAQAGSRFAVLQRVIRSILLSIDDLAQIVRFSSKAKRNKSTRTETKTNNIGDYITIICGLVTLMLIIFAPFLTEHNISAVFEIIRTEFHPWPFIL